MTKSNTTVTVQEKIDQLDQIVAWFDGDDFQLEQATTKLKEAAKLATDIEKDLSAVENDIQEVKRSFANKSDT